MKSKTIASVAMLVSTTSAFAFMAPNPGPVPEPEHYCVSLYTDDKGENATLGDCDLRERNERYDVELQKNGCAEGQAAMITRDVKIKSCPSFAQL